MTLIRRRVSIVTFFLAGFCCFSSPALAMGGTYIGTMHDAGVCKAMIAALNVQEPTSTYSCNGADMYWEKRSSSEQLEMLMF
jgi:hypothetical protein